MLSIPFFEWSTFGYSFPERTILTPFLYHLAFYCKLAETEANIIVAWFLFFIMILEESKSWRKSVQLWLVWCLLTQLAPWHSPIFVEYNLTSQCSLSSSYSYGLALARIPRTAFSRVSIQFSGRFVGPMWGLNDLLSKSKIIQLTAAIWWSQKDHYSSTALRLKWEMFYLRNCPGNF